MVVYWIMLAYVAILGLMFGDMRGRPKARVVYLVLAFSGLALLMGFRAPGVGTDTVTYCSLFRSIGISSDYLGIVKSAPVYNVLNKLLYAVSSNPRILILASAAVVCFGIAFFIYHCSDNAPLSTFFYMTLYFYLNSFNINRQMMALSVCLVAFALLLKRRRILVATALLACAVGIHNTCIVFVPLAYLGLLNISEKAFVRIVWAAVAAAAACFVFIDQLIALFSHVFPGYAQYLNALNSREYQAAGRSLIQTAFFAVVLVVFYRACVKGREDRVARVLFLIALVGVGLAAVFYRNNLIGGRISLYFTVMMIVLIPNCLSALGKGKRLFWLSTAVVSLVLMAVLLAGNYSDVVPYEASMWI